MDTRDATIAWWYTMKNGDFPMKIVIFHSYVDGNDTYIYTGWWYTYPSEK